MFKNEWQHPAVYTALNKQIMANFTALPAGWEGTKLSVSILLDARFTHHRLCKCRKLILKMLHLNCCYHLQPLAKNMEFSNLQDVPPAFLLLIKYTNHKYDTNKCFFNSWPFCLQLTSNKCWGKIRNHQKKKSRLVLCCSFLAFMPRWII